MIGERPAPSSPTLSCFARSSLRSLHGGLGSLSMSPHMDTFSPPPLITFHLLVPPDPSSANDTQGGRPCTPRRLALCLIPKLLGWIYLFAIAMRLILQTL